MLCAGLQALGTNITASVTTSASLPSRKNQITPMTSNNPPNDGFLAFDPKKMPFRRFGSTGLRVPIFAMGSCVSYLIASPRNRGRYLCLTLQGSLSVPRLRKVLLRTSSGSLFRMGSTCSTPLRVMVLEVPRSSCESHPSFAYTMLELIDRVLRLAGDSAVNL